MDLQQPLPEVGQSVGVRGRIRENREMRYCPFGVQAVGKREAVVPDFALAGFRAGGFSRPCGGRFCSFWISTLGGAPTQELMVPRGGSTVSRRWRNWELIPKGDNNDP